MRVLNLPHTKNGYQIFFFFNLGHLKNLKVRSRLFFQTDWDDWFFCIANSVLSFISHKQTFFPIKIQVHKTNGVVTHMGTAKIFSISHHISSHLTTLLEGDYLQRIKVTKATDICWGQFWWSFPTEDWAPHSRWETSCRLTLMTETQTINRIPKGHWNIIEIQTFGRMPTMGRFR